MQLASGVWERPLEVSSQGFNVEAVSMVCFPCRGSEAHMMGGRQSGE